MIQLVKSHLIRCAPNFSHSGANPPALTNMAHLIKPKRKIPLTKKLALISLTLYQVLNGWQVSKAIGQTPNDHPTEEQSIILKWLGNAGWEIRYGKTIILIDPFLTRREAVLGAEWKTDEEAVTGVISKADFIFAGHSHVDHIGDVPFIAKKFGSKVIGSRTTANIALTAGVDKSQLVTISGGEKLDFKEFSVQVIESVHGAVMRRGVRRRPKFEEITSPWAGPLMGSSFVEGGCYLYYFTFGKHRILHQSTGGFIEENLSGLRPEIALLYPMNRNDVAEMLKMLQPKSVFVHHFDEWRVPIAEGMPEGNRKRAQRFANDVRALNSNIKIVIPDFFSLFTLE
jgi:L-ascorbate metabolism protein UlaG (beta-lactamase superfamily)